MINLKTIILAVFISSTVLQVVYSIDFVLVRGKKIACGGPSLPECPRRTYCYYAPTDAFAYCAWPEKQLPDDALIDAGGNFIECNPEWQCGTLKAVCKPHPTLPTSYCAHPK